MNRVDSDAEERIAIWLGDEPGRLQKDKLLEDLDSLYGRGPSDASIARAEGLLRESMQHVINEAIYYGILQESPVGRIFVAMNERGVLAVEIGMSEGEFVRYLHQSVGDPVFHSQETVGPALEQLHEYFQGRRKTFELPLSLSQLTQFQRSVLEATMDISCGRVTTYGEIARRLGKSRAARAVGQALARNPIPILIPCHRVLGSDGALHGYSGGKGIETKRQLLQLEGILNV